jgi:TusA-related sulfurtransferase
MKEVDARGLSCPQPVILTTDAIKEGVFPFTVIVDSVTSRNNVERIARKKGCSVTVSESDDQYSLVIERV